MRQLKAAGKRQLTLLHCHTARTEWTKAHPDQRVQVAKAPWPEQRTSCESYLQQMKSIWCVNITAKRHIDDEAACDTLLRKECECSMVSSFSLGDGFIGF